MKASVLLFVLVCSAAFAQTYNESVLYSFGSTSGDGSNPVGGLVMDSAGNLYGTNQVGGSNAGLCDQGGCGTVFKLSPSGVETILHTFTAGTDGALPNASLAIDKSGNLYGTTMFGGLGKGIVFKITAAGKYSILHTFGRTAGDGSYPMSPLVLDGAGNIYGVTSDSNTCTNDCPPSAKDSGFGVVFKLTPRGAETILYAFTGGSDGAWPLGNVVRDAAGNLYGTTFSGGAFGGGTLWKLTSRNVLTTLYSFCQQSNCADGTNPGFLRRSTAGDLYVTVSSVNGNGAGGGITKVTTQNAESVIYNFCEGVFSCSAGYGPQGSTLLTSGTVFGTTEWGGTSGVGTVYSVADSGVETVLYSFSQSTPDASSPMGGVISDSKGNLYGTTVGGGAFGMGAVWKLTKN